MKDLVIEELERIFQNDLNRLPSTWPATGQMALIQLTRTMDYYLLSRMFGIEGIVDIQKYHFYGWGIAINAFYDKTIAVEGVPLFPNGKSIFSWAESFLHYCGKLGEVKLIIDCLKTGLAQIKKVDSKEFQINFVNLISGVEAIEVNEFLWYSHYMDHINDSLFSPYVNKAKEIHNSMKALSFIWNDHFLGYDTTSEIDDFYLNLSTLELFKKIGYDSFPLDTLFGGLPFELYLNALCVLNSFSMKHMGFVSNQLSKGVEVDSANLIQYIMLKSDTAEFLLNAMQINIETAMEIIDILTLKDSNKSDFCSKVNGAAPPFIEISKNHILYSHSGFKTEPVMFMLNELRRRHQKDWDRALDKREGIFRNELYSIYKQERFIKINRPIVIKVDGKVLTDIDGFIYDQVTGTLALFQLKWQEPFANSMFERRSRKRNFESESNHWVQVISNWIYGKSIDQLAAAFGLNKAILKNYKKCILFVIGRNFAHFSGNEIPDERAAWAMWHQLLRLTVENPFSDEEDPLNKSYLLIKEDSPIKKAEEILSTQKVETIQMKGYRLNVII